MSNHASDDDRLARKEPQEKVPIHLKMVLTIKEAAEYSSIGINKIDAMLKLYVKSLEGLPSFQAFIIMSMSIISKLIYHRLRALDHSNGSEFMRMLLLHN